MKNLFFIFTACILFLNAAQSQIVNIPDTRFKNTLVSSLCVDNNVDGYGDADADTNDNGEISVAEALAVTHLYVHSRSIASLEGIQYFTNLQYLYCNDNQLTTLNVQGLTNLQNLGCYGNQLPTLNVQGLTNLQTLFCNNNPLTTLNVQGLTNLQSLYCNNNQLTTLNVQGLTNLQRLECYYNQLTTLNVQGLTNLQYLYCNYNQFTSLFIKNGRNQQINFSYNPNLTYICCDESELTYLQNSATANGYTNCFINSYCSFTPGGVFYTIQGIAKFDANINGCTASDRGFPNLKYNLFDNTANIVGVYVPDTSGSYNLPLQAGIYNLRPAFENPTYFNITSTTMPFTFPNVTSDTLTQNFCITPNGIHHDVEVTVIPVTPARPGFSANYQIVYKNKGTAVESDSIMLRFDDARMDFVTASIAPSSMRHDTLAWHFSNLQPFETRTITLTLNINSPMETPAVNAGDILSFQAIAYPFVTDEMPSDNRFSLRQIVVGSLDPNDKTCLEGDKITPDMVGKYLHYVIRFENTGTYAAENVVVKDMIDLTKFDIASLQMTKASHDCRTRILNGNQVEFIFENINLPFTAPNKYGFVAFKIKTKTNLTLGSTVTNKADIFFDYNFPITTNTATTQVVNVLAVENQTDTIRELYLQPNPVTDILNLQTSIAIEKCEIYDVFGRVVDTIHELYQKNQQINVAHLPQGSYFIKVFGGNGSAVARFVKM